jgi:hypothetical protein
MSASSKKKLRKELEAATLTEKQLAQQKEDKKLKIYTITFVAIMALVVIIGLSTIIGNTVSHSGIIERGTTALTIDGQKLNNAELGYYYIDNVNNFYSSIYNQYGDYASLMAQYSYGLDMTKPLNAQAYYGDENTTWADYFVDAAISSAKSTYAMYNLAQKEGFKLSEDEQAELDMALGQLNKQAVENGFSSGKEYLQALYGYGATVESFTEYTTVSAVAQAFYAAYADTLEYDSEAIRAYEKDHYGEFSSYSFSYYYLSSDKFLSGGTKDDEGKITYSDEEKQAALAAAEEAANSLLGAGSTLLFNRNVKRLEINAENDNAAITTLEDVFYSDSKIPTAVRDWLAEGNHEKGQMAVVPNTVTSTDAEGNELTVTSGYYVVYFESVNDNNSKMANVRHILFAFEGGSTDSNGNTVYTDAEKEAAKKKADDLLAQWKAGDATEDSFAALVHDNTDDSGSKENGGLYEDINEDTTFVEPFLNWALADHKPGDTEIIETEYGYHIMYYSSTDELTYRDALISATLKNNDIEKWYNAAVDAVELKEGDVSKLRLDLIITPKTGA